MWARPGRRRAASKSITQWALWLLVILTFLLGILGMRVGEASNPGPSCLDMPDGPDGPDEELQEQLLLEESDDEGPDDVPARPTIEVPGANIKVTFTEAQSV